MSSAKKVAVFGAYFNGNFGDDLMGHLLAGKLEEAGYEPVLWRGPSYEIHGKIWPTAGNVDEFLCDAGCVVFGGGMVFCNSNFPEYWSGMGDVLDACEKSKIPIIAISVGSDGHFENLHPVAGRLLRSPVLKAVSLRLEADVEPVKSFSKSRKIVQYSDIVLTSSMFRPRQIMTNVLVCMAVGRIERVLLGMAFFGMRIKGLRVCSVSQFIDTSDVSDRFIKLGGKNYSNLGVASILTAVRDCDIVIGRGLHVGMAALASGASFISYRGTGKTVTFMNEIGHGKNVVNAESRMAKPFLFLKLFQVVGAIQPSIYDSLRPLQQSAKGHYHFMLEQAEQYMRSP